MHWPNFRKRRRWEQRMEAEMRFHLETQIAEYVRQGMTPGEAELRAWREFGPIELAKDECRDEAGFQWLENLSRDLRFALRGLRKSPGFAVAATLTLALGVGANTAIFSAVYAVLLKPLPYSHPEQLYSVDIAVSLLPQLGRLTGRIQDYRKWRQTATLFSGVTAMTPAQWNLTWGGEPERVGGALVTTEFFSLLGVPPERGRGFLPEEEQPGSNRVVVISDALWRRRFAADPTLIGKTIALDGENHTIVGVATPSFTVPTGTLAYLPFAPRIDVWKPQAPTNSELEGENWNQMLLLRLKSGVTPEQGRQQLEAILNADAALHQAPPGMKFLPRLFPLRDLFAGKIRFRLVLLLGASVLVLLMACTNTASLFLARIASRSMELATRIALGAGRARVLMQMLAESLCLAAAGCGLGLLVAAAGIRILIALAPTDTGLLAEAGLQMPVLLFALAASLTAGLTAGFFPAWQACRRDNLLGLQEGVRAMLGGLRAVRARQLLVGLEMALGTALLASAALLLHSFSKIMQVDRGYAVDHILTADLAISGERYAKQPQQAAFYRALTENIRGLPGVVASGAISQIPANGDKDSQVVLLDGDTERDVQTGGRPIAGFREVTPGYFAASGTALLAGRFFTATDRVTTAIISQSLASRLWPGEQLVRVIGRQFRQGDPVRAPLLTVIGVVADVRPGAVDHRMLPQIYHPYLPPLVPSNMTVVVRAAGDPAKLSGAVRAEIRKLDSSVPIPAMHTMREVVAATVAERSFQMMLTGVFAVLALLLGAVGIYGVVGYSVAGRTREIGLRMALGAVEGQILVSVLANGLRPVWFGLAAGLGIATIAAFALRSLLFGIAPADPLSLGSVAAVLVFTAVLACYVPARRASRLDPAAALRHE
jgi:putative ABC transport system permease protein